MISSSTHHAPWTPRHSLALAAIVAAGAGLRVYALGAESAWLDEAFSISTARLGLANVVYETRLDVHPPLYYVLLTGWFAVAESSVWGARLLSVVLSVAVVLAACGVGTRLAGRNVGLMTAALLSVSVFQVEFAQEARMYALLALLATLSTAGFIRLYRDERRAAALPYAVATALMVWTHVYAVFVIAAHALGIVADLAWRRSAAVGPAVRWTWAQVVVLLLLLPWLPAFTWQLSLVQTSFWIADPEPWGFLDAFPTFAGDPALLWLFVPLALYGAVHLASRPASPEPLGRPAAFFLVPWLVSPVLFPYLLSLVSQPIYLPKYTIAAAVPFAMLAAAGVARLPWASVRAAVLVISVGWSASLLPDLYARPTKDGWRDAVPVVERLARPSDAVVLYPYFNKIAWDLYGRRNDLQVRPFPLYSTPPPIDGWPVTITRATADRDRVWLVTLAADRSARAVLSAFAVTHTVSAHQVRQKVVVYRLDRR